MPHIACEKLEWAYFFRANWGSTAGLMQQISFIIW